MENPKNVPSVMPAAFTKAPAPATPDYAALVGKTFAIKDAEGSAADRRFKVAKFIPALDFGVKRKGKLAAFLVVRTDGGTERMPFNPPADEFLAAHTEVKE